MRDAVRDQADLESTVRAQVEAARATGGIYAHFVGRWVVLWGTRTHYVARVIGTVDTPGGSVLWADEAYDAENVTPTGIEGAQKLGGSAECPIALHTSHTSAVFLPPWGDTRGF